MRTAAILLLGVFLSASALDAQTLRGSRAALDTQNRQARDHDFTYLATPAQVKRFASLGLLVPVTGNADYELARVSFPYARPEAMLFIERLAAQYRASCGDKLVVTSLTRPHSHQPRNASARSVHPTGMAIDLRVPTNTTCRRWLERTLLSLESRGVLDATRENRPPHYHVAVFPRPYQRYVDSLIRSAESTVRLAAAQTRADMVEYRVNRGDTLWGIARDMGVSVDELKELNGLRSGRIYAGQVLTVRPAR